MGRGDNVIGQVAERGNCIGCGVCSALCPADALEVSVTERGFLVVGPTEAACRACGRCLTVCPFAPDARDEDAIGRELFGDVPGMRHHPAVGYWTHASIGASRDPSVRHAAASGGMITAVASELLRSGTVSRVAHVAPTGRSDRLFEYRLATDSAQLLAGAGSAYYPVTMQNVLREVRADPAPTAFVTLPCHAKALRLACASSPRLRESVRVVLGLTCGQAVGTRMVAYLASRAGLATGDVHSVRFRDKSDADPSAQQYGIRLETADKAVRLTWAKDMAPPFLAGAFAPQACQFCDDVFAECADAVFMDAWLPDAVRDNRGTNLAVLRSEALAGMLGDDDGMSGIDSEPIGIESVVMSQRSAIERKRRALAYRLEHAPAFGITPPRKRGFVAPRASWLRRFVWRRAWDFSRASTGLWDSSADHRDFDAGMKRQLRAAIQARQVLRYADALRGRLGGP